VSPGAGDPGAALLAALAKRQRQVEVYEKRGRSRVFSRGPEGENIVYAVEAGWGVRAGDDRSSCFRAGSGEVPERLELPPESAVALRLPPPRQRDSALELRGLELALASEAEGMSLVTGVARELDNELAGARIESIRLDDGASESRLRSSRGIDVATRTRSAALRVEASHGEHRVSAEFIGRAASELKPLSIARRLADRLLALAGDAKPPAPGAPLLLAAPVAARLLEGVAPWLVGAGAERALAERIGAELEIGSPQVTLIDDGSRADGLLATPWDGEGVPTGAALLVEEGAFVAPLRAWWEAEDPQSATGCSRRDGWRDLPRRGVTQLLLAPDPQVHVAELLEQAGAAAYLVAAEGGIRVAPDGGFTLPVCGFTLAAGRAAGALGRCRLRGDLFGWLRGVEARARDLTFVPGDGLYGAPTVRVSGLALEPATAPRDRRGGASAADREEGRVGGL